ncbi:MAG: hypothetical protein ABI599_07845 [Flavobacteriales bacterium]
MFPSALGPFEHTTLSVDGRDLKITIGRPLFSAHTDPLGTHTFGGKELLHVDDRPQFAEVAILRAFENDGWQGRWVETYGNGKMTPGLWRDWHAEGPGMQTNHPITDAWVRDRLHAIAMANGNTYSGCWDVVAWKGERLVFAESKKAKKDRMRGTQLRWLEAAMRCGMKADDFLLVEWSTS